MIKDVSDIYKKFMKSIYEAKDIDELKTIGKMILPILKNC